MEHFPEHTQAEQDAESKTRISQARRIREVIESVFNDHELSEDIGLPPAHSNQNNLNA